jgi:hypothetical protein
VVDSCSMSEDSSVGHGIPPSRTAGEQLNGLCCSLLVGIDTRAGIPNGEQL